MDNFKTKSALKVNEGIEQPPIINQKAIARRRAQKPLIKVEDKYYLEGIKFGDITILAKAITLIESALPLHRKQAIRILEASVPKSGNSLRIGITGVPGVGKSTFIEAFGKHLTGLGHKVAILAIDPSSSRTKGSILGDKTRMEDLSTDPNAFIRPSPSGGSLGGVARKTYETIILCEAAGFDIILVETVGVGQSETAAHSMVDFFLLLMLAGAGDELQGIKRGIIEMSDAIIINKADGNNIDAARRAMLEYQNALHLFPPTNSNWIPRTGMCSAYEKSGIKEIYDLILEYTKLTKSNGFFSENRRLQELMRFRKTIEEILISNFYEQKDIKKEILAMEELIKSKQISSYTAAEKIINL
jgi:LAO/AO transport system kinase